MLNKSININRVKSISIVAIIIGMLFCAPCYSQIDNDKVKSEFINFEVLEIAPIYPGCDISASIEAKKTCFSNNINKLVGQNFNLKLGKSLGLKGRYKIISQFVINKSGEITDIKVRAPHPELEMETKRVINLIPQLQPGKQDGKPVNVAFTLPIQFNIQE